MDQSAVVEQLTAGSHPSGLGRPVQLGLIGTGIQLSRTPAMHEAEGARQGMRLIYRLLDTDLMAKERRDVGGILAAAELCGFAGVNVTYPYKRDVMAHCDVLSEAATRVGAVNTVVFRDGKRFGHNTDCSGFALGFRRGMDGVAMGSAILLGAGGAGGAVAHALFDCGLGKLYLRDVNAANAAALWDNLRQRVGEDRVAIVSDPAYVAGSVDGIVNASPVGMAKLPGLPLDAGLIEKRHWVADVVYFPLETELLKTARQAGCRIQPGSGMALFQAVRAFELFTGVAPDVSAMQETFDSLNG